MNVESQQDVNGSNHHGQQPQKQKQKRKVCARCNRPERVCLCPSLPDNPIGILGTVIVLQHPHELKKALATVPLLKQTLQHFHIIVGRKLMASLTPQVKALLDATRAAALHEGGQQLPTSSHASAPPLYILFPGEDAKPVGEVAMSAPHLAHLCAAFKQQHTEAHHETPEQHQQDQQDQQRQEQSGLQEHQQHQEQQQQENSGPQQHHQHREHHEQQQQEQLGLQQQQQQQLEYQDQQQQGRLGLQQQQEQQEQLRQERPAYVLLVVDGTWQQAKEMFNALKPDLLPPLGRGLQVCLPPEQYLQPPQQILQPSQQTLQPSQQPLQPAQQPLQSSQPPQPQKGKPEDGKAGDGKAGNKGMHIAEVDQAGQAQETGHGSKENAAELAARLAVDAKNRHAGLLRKEPVEGYMTTYEAICRAVAALEGSLHACTHPGMEECVPTSPQPDLQEHKLHQQQVQQHEQHNVQQQKEQQQQLQQEKQQKFMPQPQDRQQQQQQQGSIFNSMAHSTEAWARAKQHESSLLARLLAPLQLMTAYQARWDPCTRDRIQGKPEAQSEWATDRGRIPAPKQQKKRRGNNQL